MNDNALCFTSTEKNRDNVTYVLLRMWYYFKTYYTCIHTGIVVDIHVIVPVCMLRYMRVYIQVLLLTYML